MRQSDHVTEAEGPRQKQEALSASQQLAKI